MAKVTMLDPRVKAMIRALAGAFPYFGAIPPSNTHVIVPWWALVRTSWATYVVHLEPIDFRGGFNPIRLLLRWRKSLEENQVHAPPTPTFRVPA